MATTCLHTNHQRKDQVLLPQSNQMRLLIPPAVPVETASDSNILILVIE